MTKSEAQTRSELIDRQLAQACGDVTNPTQVIQEFDILVDSPSLTTAEPPSPYAGHQFSDYVLFGKKRQATGCG